MELMGDGLIAFLAAVGVSTILWLLAETLLHRHRPVAEAILVLWSQMYGEVHEKPNEEY